MPCMAQDRIKVQVEFRKALWTCPVCGIEEIENRPMEGGASYEHICKNGHKFNQSAGAMKEYNSVISYPYTDYPTVTQKEIDDEKTVRMDKWIYEIKHPAPYTPPTKAELEKMRDDKLQEAEELQRQIDEKTIIDR